VGYNNELCQSPASVYVDVWWLLHEMYYRWSTNSLSFIYGISEIIMDSLRSSVAPLQEYLLQGSILDSHCDLLLHRLNGLCDNIDSGPEKFHDQELVYTLRKYDVSALTAYMSTNCSDAQITDSLNSGNVSVDA